MLFWRCFSISNTKHQTNEEIRDKEVRLIDADGSQLGVMPIANAMRVAFNRGLDLVKIAPQAVPPVCKVMDYGKFRFEQAKREKEARKNQHVVDIKEVQLSVGIGIHDYNVKLGHAKRFIGDGDKVKVSVRFRGREMAHTSLGQELLLKFADECAETAVVEKAPKLEGRQMLLFLAPKPAKVEKAEKPAKAPRAEESNSEGAAESTES
ncbi:MAG: translation initiation factor IF-3 [Clostridiaceae bacterium]|nr:translation initiation factor IF-3 [Clostridiaceae bacterium]